MLGFEFPRSDIDQSESDTSRICVELHHLFEIFRVGYIRRLSEGNDLSSRSLNMCRLNGDYLLNRFSMKILKLPDLCTLLEIYHQ